MPKTYKAQDKRLTSLEAENKRLKAQVENIDNQLFILQDVLAAMPQDTTVASSADKSTKTKAKTKTTKAKKDAMVVDFRQAFEVYQDGKYDEAEVLFSRFIKDNPKSKFAQRAQYLLGECYFKQKEYFLAINEFYQVPIDYPNSKMVKKALLRAGDSYLLINEPEMAKNTFMQLTVMFPLTTEALYGQQKLFTLEENL